MPDELHLSLWLRDFRPDNMLRHFEEMLRMFPYSNLRPGVAALKIYAMEFVEPPVLEHLFAGEVDLDTLMGMCREFENADCCYTVDGWWEQWHYNNGWKLTPSRVWLTCYGPEFENDEQDQLRIDFGAESSFLPDPRLPDSARAVRSNVKSLLRLVSELTKSLPLERKNLWADSGENFAERLEAEMDGEVLF